MKYKYTYISIAVALFLFLLLLFFILRKPETKSELEKNNEQDIINNKGQKKKVIEEPSYENDDKKYVDLYNSLSTNIENIPDALNEDIIIRLKRELAYVLRQKYGKNSLTASVRQDTFKINSSNEILLLIDVIEKNETYSIRIERFKAEATVAVNCAPQNQQLDPKKSKCENTPSADSLYFPKG